MRSRCCGQPAALTVVYCGHTSMSCAAAAVIAWLRQSVGKPGGVFALLFDGGLPGSSGG